MINNNMGNFNMQGGNISYGAVKDVVPQNVSEKLPENIQNIDATQIANNNGAVSAAAGMSPDTFVKTLPIYGSFVALRSLNDAKNPIFSFAGEYEKTTLGKLAKAGDFISNGISKIIPDSIEKGFTKNVARAKNWLIDNSSVARSFLTPLKLEHSMAKSEANGLFGRVIMDDATLFEKGFKGDVVKLFKGDGTGEFWKLLQSKGIETAADNKKAIEIVKNELNELANMPVKSKKVQGYVKEIIEKLSQSNEKAVIDNWVLPKIPVVGKPFVLEVPMSEIANKLRVAAGISGNDVKKGAAAAGAVGTTILGRALPSAFAKVYEGITSNFVGGKIAPFLQAFFLAQAIARAKEAPEGQKLATFMDEEVAGVSTLFTMPLATSILTRMGGTKYIGMGKTGAQQVANVQKYHDMIKALNDKVDAKTITRGEYLKEVKNIKNFLKGDTKFWQKPIKAFGKLIGSNYNSETIKPFLEEATSNMSSMKALGLNMSNKVQNLMYKFKSGKFFGMTPGGVLRFGIVLFALSPLVSKPIRAVVNKIFGKPYDPVKEQEEQTKKQQEENMKNDPFASMSEQELMELLSKNQNTIMKIQNDPALMQEIQNNPQKLYDLLQEGAKKRDEAVKNAPLSPLLQNYLKNKGANYTNPSMPNQTPNIPNQTPYVPNQANMQPNFNNQFNNGGMNQSMNVFPNAQMPKPSVQTPAPNNNSNNNQQAAEPKRTYIPSSKPIDFSKAEQIQDERFNALIADIDKTEKEFSQYLSI